MAIAPFDHNTVAAEVPDDGNAIRTVGIVAPIVLAEKPHICAGLGGDSFYPPFENLICHMENPFQPSRLVLYSSSYSLPVTMRWQTSAM